VFENATFHDLFTLCQDASSYLLYFHVLSWIGWNSSILPVVWFTAFNFIYIITISRSGTITPQNQSSIDAGENQSALSGSQLIERLTSLEGRQSDLAAKRSRFQQRKREDWRTRTQPVTQQEIQFADRY